jgi:hypothetical protein
VAGNTRFLGSGVSVLSDRIAYTSARSRQSVPFVGLCVCKYNAINQLINAKYQSVGNSYKKPILNDIFYNLIHIIHIILRKVKFENLKLYPEES